MVSLYNFLTDSQSQARSSDEGVVAGTSVSSEEMGHIFGIDTDARVTDANLNGLLVSGDLQSDDRFFLVPNVFHCVAQEIGNELFNQVSVAEDEEAFGEQRSKSDALFGSDHAVFFTEFFEDFTQGKRGEYEVFMESVKARKREEIIDKF